MSSTNRGYERHKTDYYVTPQKPIRDFLSLFLINEEITNPEKLSWLDPCAGGDEKNDMSYPAVIKELVSEYARISTIDIREDSKAKTKEDYLKSDILPFNVIITNPPFFIAREIIEKAFEDVSPDGYVIMLLRLNFWGSKSRRDFFKKHMPKYCYIHSRRMSFTDDSKTDSIEYAHFVWQKGYNTNFCATKLI